MGLELLIAGAKALFDVAKQYVKGAVKDIIVDVVRGYGTRNALPSRANPDADIRANIRMAQEIAAEEKELFAKLQRDGAHSAADRDLIAKLEGQLEEAKAALQQATMKKSAQDLQANANSAVNLLLDSDELAANIGLLTEKKCASCGGAMRIRSGGWSASNEAHKFFWQCVDKPLRCPTESVDVHKVQMGMVRMPDSDLDVPVKERHEAWGKDDVLAKTHSRLRGHLGQRDEAVTCVKHALPMLMLQKANPKPDEPEPNK